MGMNLGGDADPEEAKMRQRQKAFEATRAAFEGAPAAVERRTMGAEQKDSEDHFKSGSCEIGGDDTSMAFDRVYDSRFDDKDMESKFTSGMILDDSADDGQTFDAVYDDRFKNYDTDSHFRGGRMQLVSGDAFGPGRARDPLRPRFTALSKEELKPPHRPKFWHRPKQLSEEMQGHLSEMVFASDATPGDGKGGGAEEGGKVFGRVKALPSSQSKFAWNADRVALELTSKFDQLTHRQEDHIRKLLWTVGNDPEFEPAYASASANKNAIQVPR